jgi:3-hydroxyacyl-[acyl-carrier-protein] dehydratase
VNEILKALPHRYPMIMIDAVVSVETNVRAVARKCVSLADPCFQGHFPGDPLYPGALLIEAMAQTTALVYAAGDGEVGYLAGIKNLRFYRPVRPGDVLTIECQVLDRVDHVISVAASIHRDADLVCKGVLTVTTGRGDG